MSSALCLQSRSRLKWRSQKSLAFGAEGFTASPLCIQLRPARFSQAAEWIASYRPGEDNRQEGQGSPDRENKLQVSDVFFSLLRGRRRPKRAAVFFSPS